MIPEWAKPLEKKRSVPSWAKPLFVYEDKKGKIPVWAKPLLKLADEKAEEKVESDNNAEWTGEWSKKESYDVKSVVRVKGSFYVAIKANGKKHGNVSQPGSTKGWKRFWLFLGGQANDFPFTGGIRNLIKSEIEAVLTGEITTHTHPGGAGSGDVVGPASATDNGLARYDTTTGKLIQDSTVTLSDDDRISTLTSIDYESADTSKWRTYINDSGAWVIDSLEFSVASFTDDETATQLIGLGEWSASGITFTATYNNGPPTTATIQVSGNGITPWVTPLDIVDGSEVSTEAVDWPTSPNDVVTFTLTTDPVDPKTTTVTFKNTVLYGNSVALQSTGADENNIFSKSIFNAGWAFKLGWPDRVADVAQVRIGGVTASFNADRTLVAPTVSAPANYDNANGYGEDYVYITSTDTFASTSTVQTLSSSTPINYLYYGVLASATINEAQIEALSESTISNDNTQVWSEITAGASDYLWFCFPTRLGTVTFYVGGFEGGFESPTTVAVTNAGGFTENYYCYRSTNTNLGATTVTTQ